MEQTAYDLWAGDRDDYPRRSWSDNYREAERMVAARRLCSRDTLESYEDITASQMQKVSGQDEKVGKKTSTKGSPRKDVDKRQRFKGTTKSTVESAEDKEATHGSEEQKPTFA